MIGIGLYGNNGHQIQRALAKHPRARLAATAAFDIAQLPEELRSDPDIRHYPTLSEMLTDARVNAVSLCSPRRADQACETIACLRAERHAYAEKPCALTEKDLDAIVAASVETGLVFREMAGTGFWQPFLTMREIVRAGTIGTVVQVFAQKSYPYHDFRPQDEEVDGGLTTQAGVHAMRFVEHVACQRVTEVHAIETRLGNPHPGELRMATSYMLRLENGGVGTVLANYLNPKGFGLWGNDQLRVFGTLGFVEAVDGGIRTRLVVGDQDLGPLDASGPGVDNFECFLDEIEGHRTNPLSLEEELHPTRVVIRAKQSAMRG